MMAVLVRMLLIIALMISLIDFVFNHCLLQYQKDVVVFYSASWN